MYAIQDDDLLHANVKDSEYPSFHENMFLLIICSQTVITQFARGYRITLNFKEEVLSFYILKIWLTESLFESYLFNTLSFFFGGGY